MSNSFEGCAKKHIFLVCNSFPKEHCDIRWQSKSILVAASECLEGPDLGVGRIFNHSWTESTLYNTEIRSQHFAISKLKRKHKLRPFKLWSNLCVQQIWNVITSLTADDLNLGTHAWKGRLLTLCLSNLWWGIAIIIQLAQILSPGSTMTQLPCQTVFVSIWPRLVWYQWYQKMDATSISDGIIRIDADLPVVISWILIQKMFSILHNRISKYPGTCICQYEPVFK